MTPNIYSYYYDYVLNNIFLCFHRNCFCPEYAWDLDPLLFESEGKKRRKDVLQAEIFQRRHQIW